MTIVFIIYAAIGCLMVFFLQKFPFYRLPFVGRWFVDGFLHDLFGCDLCLGVWVYSILAYIMQIDLLAGWFSPTPVLSHLITGAATSFMVHLIRVGWQAEYTEIHIKAE